MSVEKRPEDHPYVEPSAQEQWERSFSVAIRKAVDDLFTCQPITERVQQSEDDDRLKMLLSERKLILAEQIEETTGRTIDDVLGQLDFLKAQPGLSVEAVLDRRDDLNPRLKAGA